MTRIHRPPDALAAPRFTGPRTFARLPNLDTLDDVDCAVFGMPWDGGTTFRSGARFGPEAIRSASGMIRTYNQAQKVQVFGALSAVDFGDAPTAPGYIEETLRRIEAYVKPIAAAGVVPLGMGGDHSVTLAELRALASVHGPLGLVHLDAHCDLWDRYYGFEYSHGTVFRRAIEAGALDASRVIQAGMRGSLYGDVNWPAIVALVLGLAAGWAWEYGLVGPLQGPIAKALGNTDFSWAAGMFVAGGLYYFLARGTTTERLART
jgi:agmatinase